jgi:hypothetical protein
VLWILFVDWMTEESVDADSGSWRGDVTVRRKEVRVWSAPRISIEETEQGSVELRWTWD